MVGENPPQKEHQALDEALFPAPGEHYSYLFVNQSKIKNELQLLQYNPPMAAVPSAGIACAFLHAVPEFSIAKPRKQMGKYRLSVLPQRTSSRKMLPKHA